MRKVLELKHIEKRYSTSDSLVLRDVSIECFESQVTALLGPSGSGKSTLLHIAGLIDSPTSGEVWIDGQKVHVSKDNERTMLRLKSIGFVYQYHHLLQEFTALENVILPQLIANRSEKIAKDYAKHLLCELGLEEKINVFPSELSGGQKQRVAIARALANNPILLLADEPTGNLDPETAQYVFDDLLKVVNETKMSCVIATHNYDLAAKMHRQCIISEGKLIEQ